MAHLKNLVSMNYKKLQIITFLSLLVLGLVFATAIFWPFLSIIALAAILAILFLPLMRRIESRIKSKPISAGLTVLIIVLMFVIPIGLFGQLLYGEISDLVHQIKSGALVISQDQIIASLPESLRHSIVSLSSSLNELATNLTNNAFQGFLSLISNVASFFVSVFLLLFTTYYLLRDGHRIKAVIMDISPIASAQEHILFTKVVAAVNGVVKGAFLIALIQGTVATLGYIIFKLPNPLLWGLFTVMAALVPNVGTSIALIPAIAYLIITGHTSSAIGLTIWGAVAVGMIDNVVSPKLIGARAKLHPVLVLFSVVGGIRLFGLLGFLIGPILMAVFVALIEMYRTDFKQYLEQ